MAVVPFVPTFASNDSSLSNLQYLAQCVSFIVDNDTTPVWHFYSTATQAVTSGSWTNLTKATSIAVDNDGVQSSGLAVIVTPGYYSVEACVPWKSITGSNGVFARFSYTAGANGILTPGTQQFFATKGGQSVQTASQDTVICIQDIVPQFCYPGDTVAVQGFCVSNASTNFTTNLNYISGRFPLNFTGYYIRTGP